MWNIRDLYWEQFLICRHHLLKKLVIYEGDSGDSDSLMYIY